MLALLLLGIGPQSAPAQTKVKLTEIEARAAFLYSVLPFIDWPAESLTEEDSPIIIGVWGDDAFAKFLEDFLREESVKNRKLEVRRPQKSEEAKACHLLFFSKNAGRFAPVLRDLNQAAILTVGDAGDFTRQGGIIRLFFESNKVRFEVNIDAVKCQGVTVSGQLLKIAKVVELGCGPGGR